MNGTLPLIIIFSILILLAVSLTGGFSLQPATNDPEPTGTEYNVGTDNPTISPPVLQLLPLNQGYPEPTDRTPLPTTAPGSCGNTYAFAEQQIILGMLPAITPVTVQANTEIKIFVGDELAMIVAGLNNDPRGRDNRQPYAYLLRPAIYLTKLTSANQNGPYSGDAENGGQPYDPSKIYGVRKYLNQTPEPAANGPVGVGVFPDLSKPIIINGIPDPIQTNGFYTAPGLSDFSHVTELVWDTSTLALDPGSTYRAEIVIHDGDRWNGSPGYPIADVAEQCVLLIAP